MDTSVFQVLIGRHHQFARFLLFLRSDHFRDNVQEVKLSMCHQLPGHRCFFNVNPLPMNFYNSTDFLKILCKSGHCFRNKEASLVFHVTVLHSSILLTSVDQQLLMFKVDCWYFTQNDHYFRDIRTAWHASSLPFRLLNRPTGLANHFFYRSGQIFMGFMGFYIF